MLNIRVKRILDLTVVACVVLIISCTFIFADSPEIFKGGAKLCDIMVQLSIGYLVSYIFHLLVVRIPEKSKIKNINRTIKKPLERLLFNMETPINHLVSKVYNGQDVDRTEAIFKHICENIDPKEGAPMTVGPGVNGNYLQYLSYHLFNVRKYCTEILDYNTLLEPEFILRLSEIKDSQYHEALEGFFQRWMECLKHKL